MSNYCKLTNTYNTYEHYTPTYTPTPTPYCMSLNPSNPTNQKPLFRWPTENANATPNFKCACSENYTNF